MTNQHQPAITSHRSPQSAAGTAAAQDRVRQYLNHGATYRDIAEAAGIGTMTVHDLANSRRQQPTRHAVAAVLKIRQAPPPQLRVDAGGTRLRLRALYVMGHGSARLARATGISERTIRALVNGEAATVSVKLRDTITTIYDRWWDKRAPERTAAERSAATLARRRAIRGNWCTAAALDDDELDIPGYKPRYGWRPATGTGVADDINAPRRPVRRRRA